MRKMRTGQSVTLDVEAILERLKEAYGLASDADLARFLEMTPSGISTWKRRGTLDLSAIVEKCLATPVAGEKVVNFNWLIVGQGNASLDTIQSIVIDEIAKQTPVIMQEIVSKVVNRLRAEGVIPAEDAQLLEPVDREKGIRQSSQRKGV